MTLIHWWKLDEVSGGGAYLLDSVGSAHGTPTGTASVPGLFSNARSFTTTGDIVTCAWAADLAFTTEDFTIGCWMRPTLDASVGRYAVNRNDGSTDRSYWLVTLPTTGQAGFYASGDGSTGIGGESVGNVCDGGLHWVVVTRVGTVGKIYVDGALSNTITLPASIFAGTRNLEIGNVGTVNTRFLNGWIDNVQIWNNALSATAISNLYYKALSSLSLDNQVPAPSATGIARDTNIQLSFVADASSIVLSTIDLWVKGAPAYDGATDAFIAPYNGPASARTGTPAQYDFIIDPVTDFDYDETVSVRAYGQDDAAHTVDQTWSFDVTEDVTAPSVDNRNPAPSQINVRWKSDVYLEIYETETLVQRNTIRVYVAGTLAFDGATGFQTGFTGSVLPADATAARYYVTVNPDTNFGFSTSVTVRVVARNTSVPYEELDTSYSFTTEAKSISLTDRDPAPSETDVRTIKSPVVAVQDTTYNVVAASVDIYIDGVLAYDGTTNTFQPGYDGPGSQRTGTAAKYTYTIDPTVNFAFVDTIPIRVVAANDDDQPLDETYSFTTKGMVYNDHGSAGKILYVDTLTCVALTNIGLLYRRDPSTPYIEDLQIPNNEITFESRIIPALSASVSYLLRGSEMTFGFNHAGNGFWTYIAKGKTNTFIQRNLAGLRRNENSNFCLRHVFGNATSTAMIVNATIINGRWYGTFPEQTSGSGSITAFANVGGGIVRVTSNGHGMATGTWVRIYGTTNYNDVFQIANAQPNTFDITATWVADDGAGTWDKTNNDHNLAGWTKPAFAVGDYEVALGHDDLLVMFSMNSVAKTTTTLLEIARGRA